MEGASIMDLAPSILSHLQVEAPAYMKGRSLGELGVTNVTHLAVGDREGASKRLADLVAMWRLPRRFHRHATIRALQPEPKKQ